MNCDMDTPSRSILSVTTTTQHAPACTTQALSRRLKGPDTRSYPLMLPTLRLRPGITAATNTSANFSRIKQISANCQNSNISVSIAQAGFNRQTPLGDLTTASSKDLSTGGRPCVNSGGGKQSHYLPSPCDNQTKDNGDDCHIMPTSDNTNKLPKFGQVDID